MDELKRMKLTEKKLAAKGYMWYDSMYMKF